MTIARALVVWCPDWPAVAAAQQARLPSVDPVAVFRANRVQVCNAAARAEGIRVGIRRRDAQSRCPTLAVLPADPDRDARLFEPIAAAVEAIAPGVEVLRPGMVACQIRGPARYFGSEIAAAERLVDAVETLDVECSIGIADVLAVAVLAAKQSAIIPPTETAAFCSRLPIAELARDPAIAAPEWSELASLLRRLGITTAGAFAALPIEKVADRFGTAGVAMHRLAAGRAERGLSRRRIDSDLALEQHCDPPLERVDTAAFVARALAERFHTRLVTAGLACTRLAITATTEYGEKLSRVWRCSQPLTAAATADRLRWQLDGWLTGSARTSSAQDNNAHTSGEVRAGMLTLLRLEPIEAVDAGQIQYGLWGLDGRGEHRAGWAFARVQGLLGPDAVQAAARSGGRGPADRIATAAWGEENPPERDPAAPWPGALPSPAPAQAQIALAQLQNQLQAAPLQAQTVTNQAPAAMAQTTATPTVTVCDPSGYQIVVTARGMLTSPPAVVEGRRVVSWAGPWLVDERWWTGSVTAPPYRQARMQVITESGPPVLLEFSARGWQLEAVYD